MGRGSVLCHTSLIERALAIASHSGSATKVHSLRGLEMLLRFDVARSPYQNESRLIALTASRETLSKYASNLMLLCMFRIVDHSVNS
jgi:hypothetical protein